MFDLTDEQVEFIKRLWELVEFWNDTERDKHEALQGLAFSFLTTLDCVSVDYTPPPGDQLIGQFLHDWFYAYRPEVTNAE